MTGTAEPRFYATRNSTTAWRDEDIAMTHEHWGPFPSVDKARAELVRQMRAEADRTQSTSRAKGIQDAARAIECKDLDDCQIGGVRWRISRYEH